jgi:acyl-CoA thioester hydrolase
MRGDPRRRALAAYPFIIDMVPRFGDMDANRHLNNVAIARFYEEARVRFHWHVRDTHPAAGHFRVLVAHVAIDYMGEGHWPDPLKVGVGIVELGGSSYRLGLGLFQADDCLGLCDSVLVHRGEHGTQPLPFELRAALEPMHLKL